jgi:hypothetical protein
MNEPQDRPLWQRLGWMLAIWLASITLLGLVASVIRFWLKA